MSWQRVALAAGKAPELNPLKGFVPYAGRYEFPHSMEWFYLPLRAVQKEFTSFDWSALEEQLNAIASRGHQAIFRFYLDYPKEPSGLPAFLAHVPSRAYSDHDNTTSISPDYEHPDLRRALRHFIAAFGARYDGDARIGFVTIGLLGFWGEWHTWPHSDWFASTQVQNEVLDAYQTAFTRTRLLMREPKNATRAEERPFGFHDDSFAFQTLGPTPWHFWPTIERVGVAQKWRTQSIGGEVRPEVQGCLWNDISCAPLGQEFDRCVQTTHASWLLNQGAFRPLSPAQCARAARASSSLGYEFFVSHAEFAPRASTWVRGRVRLENRGVAPFPYKWPLQVGVRDATRLLQTEIVSFDLRTLQPDAQALWLDFELPLRAVPGEATLLLRVQNPLPQGVPLRFANATQDATLPGWLSLGTFEVMNR